MEQSEQLYIKGFNRGYTMTKYLPDLSASILKNIGTTNDFIEGFFSGKEEYELEYSQEQLGHLREIRDNAKDHGHELEQ